MRPLFEYFSEFGVCFKSKYGIYERQDYFGIYNAKKSVYYSVLILNSIPTSLHCIFQNNPAITLRQNNPVITLRQLTFELLINKSFL